MQGTDRRPDPPPDLPAAVSRHRDRAPEEPALFYPHGLDVRWRSWRAVAAQVAAGAAALRRAAVEPEAPVAFSWRCHPDALAAFLAIRHAGALAVPVADPVEALGAGCATWLLHPEENPPAGDPGALAGLDLVYLPEAPAPWERQGVDEAPAVARRPSTDAPPDPDVERAVALDARVRRTAAGADAAGRPRREGEREIVLANLDLRRDGDRGLLAWALVTGAALLLEPDARTVPATAAWARPTLVAAPARPLGELVRSLRVRPGRPLRRSRGRRPFGRLRLVVVLGPGRLPVDDVPEWADLGVGVLRAEAAE